MKGKKKLLLHLFLAAFSATTVAGIAACDTPDYGEGGIYYYEENGEEYLVSLSGGGFTLLMDDVNEMGVYEYDGTTITLTYKDGEEAVGTSLQGDVLTLVYDGQTYRFLKKINYTVTYDVAGGTPMANSKVVNGKTLKQPATPVKAGYKFVGWYTDSSYTTLYNFETTPVTSDITLYARFEEAVDGQNEYVVTLKDGDNTIATLNTIGGAVYDLNTYVPDKANETFVGWWTSDYEDGDKLTAEYKGQALKENTTLYAVWQGTRPVVSVTQKNISWTSVGAAASYQVRILNAAGDNLISPFTTAATSYEYDFTSRPAGDYTVVIKVDGQESYAYYNNKALDRVSNIYVSEPSMLIFEPVENAERYLLTIDCGNDDHSHKKIDLGSSTYYNFEDCEMQVDGIKFTVSAIASGYGSSESAEFSFERVLSEVEGLKINQETGKAVWNGVVGATSYRVQVGSDVYVTTATNVSLKEYTGEVTVKVTPVADGYLSPVATELTQTLTYLAAPKNVMVAMEGTQRVIKWEGDAASYVVKINGQPNTVTGNTMAWPTDGEYQIADKAYKVSVMAMGENDTYSLYTDEIEVYYNTLRGVNYSAGVVTWNGVVGAKGYNVYLNNRKVTSKPITDNKYTLELNKAGENVIQVTYLSVIDIESAKVQTTVNAYKITLDVRGGTNANTGNAIYRAAGDPLKLPTSMVKTGYTFQGWYTVPDGPKVNGAKYDDLTYQGGKDKVLYAYWKADEYDIELLVEQNEGLFGKDGDTVILTKKNKVSYNEEFQLSIPQSASPALVFGGWKADGTLITDPLGKGLTVWSVGYGTQLTAEWIEVLDFTENSDGTYTVKKGAGINYVKEVTIPEKHNDKLVTDVAASAFSNCATLETINIPDTIQTVFTGLGGPNAAGSAFKGCNALKNINVYTTGNASAPIYSSHDGVLIRLIGTQKELYYVPQAKVGEFAIPAGVATLPKNVFAHSLLEKITIPASITEVASDAFYNSKVEEIVFENGGTSLALSENVFSGCALLTDVTLPTHFTSWNAKIADGAKNLKNIFVDGEGVYSDIDGVLCNGDGDEIVYCPRGRVGEYVVPTDIEKIQASAFEGCVKLTGIVISEYVEEIQANAFAGCIRAKTLQFKASTTDLTIREGAFADCTTLSTLELPSNLKVLETRAFANTASLKNVSIQSTENLTFAANIFAQAGNRGAVTKVEIGKYTQALAIAEIFDGCRLTAIEVDKDNANYNVVDGVLYNEEKTQLLYYPYGRTETSYTVESGVTAIGAHLFEDRTNLTSFEVGAQIQSIGNYAFAGTNISTITFATRTDTQTLVVGAYAFADMLSLNTIDLTKSNATELGAGAFQNSALTKVTLPATLARMGSYDEQGNLTALDCFNGCSNLTEFVVVSGNTTYGSDDGILYGKTAGKITDLYMVPTAKAGAVDIPKTVTNIWSKAFYHNAQITEVTFSEGLEGTLTFGTQVFEGATALHSVTLPEGVTEIGEAMFKNCTALSTITIPKTVQNIDRQAFYGCSLLSNVDFTEGRTDAQTLTFATSENQGPFGETFVGCVSLKEIKFPEGTTNIPSKAFNGLTSLQKVTIPSTVVSIDDSAFYGAGVSNVIFSALEDTSLTSKLTTIAHSAFYNTKIKEFVTPSSVTTLGGNFIAGTTTLTKFTFPASYDAAKCGSFFFTSCSALEELVFPEGITSIGNGKDSIWANAPNVKKVVLASSVKELKKNAFKSAKALEEINLANVEKIGQDALRECIALKAIDISSLKESGVQSFSGCTALQSVTVPKGLTKPGATMFEKCTGLKEVTVYSELSMNMFNACTGLKKATIYSSKVPMWAFMGCSSLNTVIFAKTQVAGDGEQVTYEDKLTSIGSGAFYGCSALTTIGTSEDTLVANTAKFPETLTQIAAAAFALSGLQTVVLPEGLTKIWGATWDMVNDPLSEWCDLIGYTFGAFYMCTSLTSINIPESLTYIGDNTFNMCMMLMNVNIHKDVTYIGDNAFASCGMMMFNVTIETDEDTNKSALEYVGANAFAGTMLMSLTIPETVGNLTVGTGFVSGCPLMILTLPSTMQYTAGIFDGAKIGTLIATNDAFKADNTNFVLLSPDGKTVLSVYATNGNVYETPEGGDTPVLVEGKFAIPEGVTTISPSLFKGNTWLKEVVLPSTLTAIPESAFEGCTNLKKVTMGDNVATIGNNAFKGCTALTDITTSKALTTIGASAFENCTKLATVTFTPFKGDDEQDHYAIETLGNAAFKASGLTTFTFHEKVITIPESAFENTTKLGDIEIPITVTSIGRNAFKSSSLTSLDLKGAATLTIGASAFEGCRSITTITLPANVTSVGASAFANMAIVTVNWNTNASIPEKAFYQSTGLQNVNFGDNVDEFMEVGASAFYYCTALKSITLPNSTTKLGNSAFEKSGLTSFTFPENVSITDPAQSVKLFALCKDLATVDFNGANIQAISKQMFYMSEKSGTKYVALNSQLKTITIPDTVQIIGVAAFGSHKLTSVTLGKNVHTISDSAFAYINSENSTSKEPIVHDTISGRNGLTTAHNTLTTFTIPNDSNLTTIGKTAFAQNSKLTSIALPATLDSIGTSAFVQCTSLKTVTFKGGLSGGIGGGAFLACPIANIDLSNTEVETIGVYAFSPMDAGQTARYGAGAEGVKFPATLREIHDGAFAYSKVPILDLSGTNLEKVGIEAFTGCTSLQTVALPASLEYLCNYSSQTTNPVTGIPFDGCTALESIGVQNGNAFYYSDAYGMLYNTAGLLIVCPAKNVGDGSGSVEFAPGTTFGESAFAGCTGVVDVTLPSTLEVVPAGLFKGSSVRRVVLPEGVKEIENSAFEGCTSLAVVELPSTLTRIGSAAFRASGIASVTIPENVTSIGERAFKDCDKLVSVTLNNKLQKIGRYAFAKTAITSIVIPASVEQMGGAWDNSVISTGSSGGASGPSGPSGPSTIKPGGALNPPSSGSTTTSVPADDADELTNSRVFKDCDALQSVTFLGYPTMMYGYTFEGCGALKTVEFHGAWAKIEKGMFANSAITEIDLPDTVAIISEEAFAGTEIEAIHFPASLNVLQAKAFIDCNSLTTFTVDANNTNYMAKDGVLWSKDETTVVLYPAGKTGEVTFETGTKFAEYAFTSSNLTKVILPSDLKEIVKGLFYQSKLDVAIPNGVERIGSLAFASTTGIKNLVIPASVVDCYSVSYISSPFYCAGFETVVFQGDTQFGGTDTLGTFYNCKSLKKIVFEADITEDLGRGFVQGCSALEEVIFKGNVGKLYGCFNLSSVKRVVFEKNTGELGTTVQGMFEGASKLEEVVFLGTVEKLGADMFVGCTALKSVYLPETVLKVTGGTGNIWNTFNEFNGTIYTPLTEAQAKEKYGDGWYCGATVVYEAGKSTETAVAVKNGENRLHVTDQAIAYFKYTAASAGSVKLTATGATAVVVDADGNALTAGTDGSYTVAAGAVYVKVTVTTGAATASFEVDFTANDGSEGGDDTTGGDDDQTGGTTGGDTTGGDDDQSGGTTGGDTGGSVKPGTGTRPVTPKPGTSLRG